MKKSILLILSAIILTSCHSVNAPKINRGMTVEEFKKTTKLEELAVMDGEWLIYKVIYGLNGEFEKYYYFKDNKLEQMDSGENLQKYTIRVDHY